MSVARTRASRRLEQYTARRAGLTADRRRVASPKNPKSWRAFVVTKLWEGLIADERYLFPFVRGIDRIRDFNGRKSNLSLSSGAARLDEQCFKRQAVQGYHGY